MGKIITAEVDFKIRLDSREYSFWQYRDESYKSASQRLGYGYYNDNIQNSRSPLELFIRERLKRFSKNDDAIVFLTEYSEREGSFILSFSFFVFATFMSYGSFRESLDYVRDDINFFFRETFPSNSNIDIDYSVRQNRAADNLSRNLQKSSLAPIFKQLNILKALIGFIGILALGFSFYSVYKVENTSNSIPHDEIEKAVNVEIEKVNSRKTNEELLQLLKELKSDTTKRLP
jgi:hypothetical protein